MTNFNMFWITYVTGEVRKVEFPADWTASEVLKVHEPAGAFEIDGPYPV